MNDIIIKIEFNERSGHFETTVLEVIGNKSIFHLNDRTRRDAEQALLFAMKHARRIIRGSRNTKPGPAPRKPRPQ